MAFFLKYGERVIDTMSRHAAVMQLHASAFTDLAQRMGDEFRFWVPRTLDEVGFIHHSIL